MKLQSLKIRKKEEEEKAKYTRWKPKKGEKYYFISFGGIYLSNLSIVSKAWENNNFDYGLYNDCNCFQTAEEARETMDHLRMVLKMISLKQFFPEIKIVTSLSKFANSERCGKARELLNERRSD